MSVHITGKVARPDDVEIELTIKMSLLAWKALRSKLDPSWPSWKLSEAIGKVVSNMSATTSEVTETE